MFFRAFETLHDHAFVRRFRIAAAKYVCENATSLSELSDDVSSSTFSFLCTLPNVKPFLDACAAPGAIVKEWQTAVDRCITRVGHNYHDDEARGRVEMMLVTRIFETINALIADKNRFARLRSLLIEFALVGLVRVITSYRARLMSFVSFVILTF